jgi:sulfur carrier protein
MELTVNGKPRAVAHGTTISGLLEELRINPLRVAVQLNLEIVKRDRYDETPLQPGDRLEIISFMAGGCR